MIKVSHINDMKVVKQGEQLKKALFKIFGEKPENKNTKRMPLNISLAIDVSGSMDEQVGKNKVQLMGDGFSSAHAIDYLNNLSQINGKKTKISQVKEAAIKCIDMLEVGDYVPIVTFNNHSQVILGATKIDGNNKAAIKNKILGIHCYGGTNLHDGWLNSGMEVAKNLSSKLINRILVLTDGETNSGIVDSAEIARAVEGLAKQGISTSTFGVGDHYNEDLLEKMASVSGGNFYYIQDGEQVPAILREEFSCLNNLVANNATLEFIPNGDVSATCLNELDYVNKKFVIGNIIGGREVSILLEFQFTNTTALGSLFNLGKINLSYTNVEGKIETESIELNYHTVSEEAFATEVVDEEINVQTTILDIAKQQKLAKEAMKKGDRESAYGILKGSVMTASAYAGDARVAGSISAVNTLMDSGGAYSNEAMSKMLNSMSYNTRNSKV